jgi:hypothetical protein
MGRNVAGMGEKRNTYRVLVGKSEGERPLRRPRRMWKDDIKMDFQEIGWGDMDWINPLKTEFVLNNIYKLRKHITSPLQRPAG